MDYIKIVVVACLCCALFFTGCSGEKKADGDPSPVEAAAERRVWDSSVLVFFGEGFNSSAFTDSALALLSRQFGLEDDGGFVRTVIYPDAFLIGKTARISRLADMVDDKKIQSLVLLGAPEGTEYALAKIRDSGWEYPIISLFPQGDTVTQSSDSNVIIEAQIRRDEAAGEGALRTEGAAEVLCSVVSLLAQNQSLASGGESLKGQLEKHLGNDKRLQYYIDAQTGLRASNCFVLE